MYGGKGPGVTCDKKSVSYKSVSVIKKLCYSLGEEKNFIYLYNVIRCFSTLY